MIDLSKIFEQAFQISQFNAETLESAILFVIVSFAGWLTYLAIGKYFSRWAEKTQTTLDDAILKAVKVIAIIAIIIIGMEFALSPLPFLQQYGEQMNVIFTILEILLGAFAATRISNALVDWYLNRNNGSERRNNHLLFLLRKIVQFIAYTFAFLIILYVFQVDLTGAVVGLGIGGIALAFAVQSQLGDVLGAFSIYFDRPFEIDDFIVVGEYSGTVKSIGVRSTRLQLLQGEELVIANKELTSTSVRNFRKLEKRRVTFTIGVAYDTPLVKLKAIPEMISEIIKKTELAQLDRVNFTEFGDYSLKFMVIYYVTSSDYGKYLDTQEKINFAIKEAFERQDIEIAFPTTAVYVKK